MPEQLTDIGIIEPLLDAVRLRAAGRARAEPDGDRAMQLARQICKAHGHDPDVVVYGLGYGGRRVNPRIGVNGSTFLQEPLDPQWWAYWDQARLAIIFLEGHGE